MNWIISPNTSAGVWIREPTHAWAFVCAYAFCRDNCITENVTSKRSLVNASSYLHIAAFVRVRTTSVSCVCAWVCLSECECRWDVQQTMRTTLCSCHLKWLWKQATEQTNREAHTNTHARAAQIHHTHTHCARASSSCLKTLEVRPLFPPSAEISIWTHRHRIMYSRGHIAILLWLGKRRVMQ